MAKFGVGIIVSCFKIYFFNCLRSCSNLMLLLFSGNPKNKRPAEQWSVVLSLPIPMGYLRCLTSHFYNCPIVCDYGGARTRQFFFRYLTSLFLSLDIFSHVILRHKKGSGCADLRDRRFFLCRQLYVLQTNTSTHLKN